MKPVRLYTRNQVIEAERMAWAGSNVAGEPEFHFDGIQLWRRTKLGLDEPVLAGDVPTEGWWHRPTCNCGLCREAREAGKKRSRRVPRV